MVLTILNSCKFIFSSHLVPNLIMDERVSIRYFLKFNENWIFGCQINLWIMVLIRSSPCGMGFDLKLIEKDSREIYLIGLVTCNLQNEMKTKIWTFQSTSAVPACMRTANKS